MGRLQRVELENFKSYRGHQVIGPFHNFTSVIGPNGSGKSNLMDAISFVLGIKSSHLRSSSLKELIYRGKAMEDGPPETGANAPEAGRENQNNPTKASVLAVYVDDEQNETRFMRSVTIAGGSEYRLNERVVTYNTYSAALEKQNILPGIFWFFRQVSIARFARLLFRHAARFNAYRRFQGDVEAIASQSPKDLTKLIEQISGSLDLKQEYEELKTQQELATENSTFNFNKKRGINAEIKQYQEQKEQAERLDRLQDERPFALETFPPRT
ncbi:MAG: LOW QUALITY PROTEIN: RecF/RecN/SMC N terminal domain-containing protein [Olpidium bornovanus]|uniref:RecF/RecN/SMC N terminal domain-containing protein n=1 Tax=Olpidium bornovanus TaxID=278681 RepID=A0A8H8DIP7_9FUNG|nr:MAG: LOW QUALITY PROTEIN: RecF/RecN/SMC N terminal domain-containing protein [Olpidium bornovanus]